MVRYIRFILAFRGWVLAFVLGVSVLCGWLVSGATFGSSLEKLFFAESPEYRRYVKLTAQFTTDEVVVIGLHQPDLLQPETLRRLRQVVDRLMRNPVIQDVESVLSTQRVRGDGETLTIGTYEDLAEKTPGAAVALAQDLAKEPFARDLIISQDGQHTAVIVKLSQNHKITAEKGPELLGFIRKTFQEEGFGDTTLHFGGLQAQMSEMVEQAYTTISRIFPLVVLVLLGTTYFLYRQFFPVVITFAVSMIGMLWTMGFAVSLDNEINIMLSMVPAIMVIVAFSDIIHLCSAYILELSHGLSKDEAILKSGSEVGRACVYTSLTTFVGFASLSFVPTPVFRILGIVLGFGVGIALLLAMTLTPILLSLLREPKIFRRDHEAYTHDRMDHFVSWVTQFDLKRPRLIAVISSVITLVSLVGLSRMTIETNFLERLNPRNPMRIAANYFQEHFSGTNFLELYFTVPEVDGLLDPKRLAKIREFEAALRTFPEVDQVLSFEDLVEILHREMAPSEGKPEALPTERSLIAQYLLLFDMAGGEDLGQFLNDDRNVMRVSVRLNQEDVRLTAKLGNDAADLARKVLGPEVKVEPTGLMYLIGDWLDNIVQGQKNGLLFAAISIMGMMMLAVHSSRLGWWSMLPNLLPLLALCGVLGFAWGNVDSDTMAVMMIALGIGVDDTIHFLTRYRIELAALGDPGQAIIRAFQFAGRGIVQTTVILVLGFAPFMLSTYYSTWMVGTLLPFALIVALAGDLFLAPAMIKLGILRP